MRILKIFIITTFLLIGFSNGCLENDEEPNDINQPDYFIEYNLQTITEDNFTIVVPFLEVFDMLNEISVPNKFLLSKLKSNVSGVRLSIVDIRNEILNIDNVSQNEVVKHYGLKIEGSGNINLSLKLHGYYYCTLTFGLLNHTDGSYYLSFWNKAESNQEFQISISATLYSSAITYWNEHHRYVALEEGWNIIEIPGWGILT